MVVKGSSFRILTTGNKRVPSGLYESITRKSYFFCNSRATSAVHPVWWLAPQPLPLSPWKYS
jgi:hypothetical protein